MRILDSHQHYWDISRKDYGWLTPETGRLYTNYLPEHLKPLREKFNIQCTIVVQAAPSLEETNFLLELAEKEKSIAGVVGWLDLESDEFLDCFQFYRKHTKFIGIRPMIQDLPSDWLLKEKVMEHLRIVAEEEFPIDLQANPRHLPSILYLLEQLPSLRGVIDHIAKPPMKKGLWEPWKGLMERIASYPNIMCKISGLVPERTDAPWSRDTIKPYVDHIISIFGTERIMFGSDWPVCLYSASFEEVFQLFHSFLKASWSKKARENVFFHNAARFYKLSI
ncbi:amidohydrolase [Bacillus sp. AFS076308]|uniref:amidohydrolase family protein n=1 Tax=unclassified Bacillus (in: firmicutes) TaxID=185979 RepID=UPI000BF5BC61|nr:MULTISPECIES: amidohydrolase family protein [unclassified Bacillus (in: firmicutes)]PFN78150.1 amidohydrolase [Bacillus sp. AFS076308]PGV48657.1 amidohydrolase [Bacillus sp. AFS037270]